MNFLPEGADFLRTEKPYWKLAQMPEGDTKFRIVQRPIAGWVDWVDKKPIRTRPENKPTSHDAETPVKPFWACYVWDYARKALFVLEITQTSILKALTSYAKDEDWGDFTKYDLKVKKEGSGKETRYAITALPHKDLSPEIVEAMKRSPVHLENLYVGGDPWNVSAQAIAASPESKTTISVSIGGNELEVFSFESLKTKVADKGISIFYLEEYVRGIAEKKEKPMSEIVESALQPSIFPSFLTKYSTEVSRRQQAV